MARSRPICQCGRDRVRSLFINLKTAKALDLTVPNALSVSAN
jgi:hypothetical protein